MGGYPSLAVPLPRLCGACISPPAHSQPAAPPLRAERTGNVPQMEHDKELETQPLMDYGMCVDPMQSSGEFSGYLAADHGMSTSRHDRHRYPEY